MTRWGRRAREAWLLWLVALGLVVAGLILWAAVTEPSWLLPDVRGLRAVDRVRAETAFRSTAVILLVAFALLFGGAVAALTLLSSRRVQWRALVTDRFMRAIEQLGQPGRDRLDVRIGAVYALERIAHDAAELHGPILEVLTAHLREHAPAGSTTRSLPADQQAIATVLARRRHEQDPPDQPLDLSRVDLSGTRWRAAHLEAANLREAHLEQADLREARLEGANLERAHLGLARLSRAHLEAALLDAAHLESGHLDGAYLAAARLVGAHLRRAQLAAADLTRASLGGADLTGADLSGARLDEATLPDATLGDANLSRASLARATLTGARLTGADLSEARLEEADLANANLQDANLSRAAMARANLAGANLARADLSRARLEGATFPNASLEGTNLNGAHLRDADLSEATGLTWEQLRGAQGLEWARLPAGLATSPAGKQALEELRWRQRRQPGQS